MCENCGRRCFGFWKYRIHNSKMSCSKKCLRSLIQKGIISRLHPERGYPELGIVDPQKFKRIEE